MIFADKLIQLRKKAGWSQEELANQMNVTRQSVSKWEGAQSIPDLEKIIKLSEIFGVSTDYLLKDELEESEEGEAEITEESTPVIRVSMEEANSFLEAKQRTADKIALSVLLFILSPVALYILGTYAEVPGSKISINLAGGLGIIAIALICSVAVAILIYSGSKTAAYDYLDKEVFETEYGVCSMVKERKKEYKETHTKYNIIGVFLCMSGVIPLFLGLMLKENNELFMAYMLSLLHLIVGIGVYILVRTGILWASYEKLLQEGEYTKRNKTSPSLSSAITLTYWLIATALYLGYSFITNNWKSSWIIFVVAGILYPALLSILRAVKKDR